MKRRLFNLAAAVSLVLCLANVALWIQSYWVLDQMHFVTAPSGSGVSKMRQLAFDVDSGIISVSAEWARDNEFGHDAPGARYITDIPQEDEPGLTVHSYTPGLTPHYYSHENWRSYHPIAWEWLGLFKQDYDLIAPPPAGMVIPRLDTCANTTAGVFQSGRRRQCSACCR